MTVIHLINATLDGRCDHRSVIADDDLDAHALETITNADAILFGSSKQVLSWHAPCAVRVWSTYCACSSKPIVAGTGPNLFDPEEHYDDLTLFSVHRTASGAAALDYAFETRPAVG